MRFTRFCSTALFALLVGCASTAPPAVEGPGTSSEPAPVAVAPTVQWSAFEGEKTFKKAEQLERPVLIYFKLIDCDHCEAFEESALSDERVINMINDGFHATMVVSSDERWDDLTEGYFISMFPALSTMNASGTRGLVLIEGNESAEIVLSKLLIAFQLNRVMQAQEALKTIMDLPIFVGEEDDEDDDQPDTGSDSENL